MTYLIIGVSALIVVILIAYYEQNLWWRKYKAKPHNFQFKHKGKKLWHSRACAVASFIFNQSDNGEWFVLANQRGRGVPQFKNFWNCPCGFVDYNESTVDAAYRETKEECGVAIPKGAFQLYGINSDPIDSVDQTIAIRYYVKLSSDMVSIVDLVPYVTNEGEKDEVTDARWIPISEIDKYRWAFNHDKIIKEIYETKIK